METTQNNAGGQAQQTAQTKLNFILEELQKIEKRELEWLERCKKHYGFHSCKYDLAFSRWIQSYHAVKLVKNCINDQL